MRRILIVLGLLIVVVGIAWPWISKLPLGRLPGDIVIDRPDLKIFIPITTMIIVSVVLSVIFWLMRK